MNSFANTDNCRPPCNRLEDIRQTELECPHIVSPSKWDDKSQFYNVAVNILLVTETNVHPKVSLMSSVYIFHRLSVH